MLLAGGGDPVGDASVQRWTVALSPVFDKS
jgi:hypothetical protein